MDNYCRLIPGSSFIFNGSYCSVTIVKRNHFEYINQEIPDVRCFMTYKFYLTTNSAKGRKIKV